VRRDKNRLFAFQKKLRTLTFLDPACGCGNFLVVTYRELRRLELEVIRAAWEFGAGFGTLVDVFRAVQLNVDQFYGIEVEEFPAQIAQVALWLTDHQMNVEAGEEFGEYFNRIPLKTSASIRHGNALRLDWEEFVPPTRLAFILGNPPFIGKQHQTAEQKADMAAITQGIKGAGVLDYVAGWYLKAAHYLSGRKHGQAHRDKKLFQDVRFGQTFVGDLFEELEQADETARKKIRCAFVSTNSITQGEQVGVLWSELLRQGMRIHFAHRTFKWSNEAPGRAAVHCVIVGFGRGEVARARLFDYADPAGEAHELPAARINPYLVDAPTTILPNRDLPICEVPRIGIGNKPIDGGNYLFTTEEKAEFLAHEPKAEKWFRRWIGADEFLNGYERWCLWLGDCPPDELRQMPQALKRVDAVRRFRLASKSAPTNKLAETPTRFHVENMPASPFLVIPKVSSERRHYIPIGFMAPDTLCSDLVFIFPKATLTHFGILQSTMHMAWVRYVCGRLKSDYRYSAGIVYNNFPWPSVVTIHPTSTSGAAHGHCDLRYAGTHRSPEEIRAVGTAVRGDCAGDSESAGQTGDAGLSGSEIHTRTCADQSRPAGAEMDDGRGDRGERSADADQTARAVTTSALKTAIEAAAQAVLDARAAHPGSSLADLYDPNAMPDDLRRAHKALDKAVDTAYQADDAERVGFLFQRYAALTSLLGGAAP